MWETLKNITGLENVSHHNFTNIKYLEVNNTKVNHHVQIAYELNRMLLFYWSS